MTEDRQARNDTGAILLVYHEKAVNNHCDVIMP